MNTTASGLQFEDTVAGTGAEAQRGNRVSVHYTGCYITMASRVPSSIQARIAASHSSFRSVVDK